MNFDINKIRADFPILNEKVYNKPLVYFDNGATTQKPQVVLNEIINWYTKNNSNIHRGVHYLSQQATEKYEAARKTIQRFINAPKKEEVIFTKGTTDSINTIAHSFGEHFLQPGDEVILTQMEHHANIVPWQLLRDRKKINLKYLHLNNKGEINTDELKTLITPKTKLVGLVHVSNSLGTINPVKKIIDHAHQHNIPVLIDGAQSVQHLNIDVQALDCDFFVFSGHKIYGPTGIGVLYGKEKWLSKMPPYQGGGDMVDTVTLEKTTFNVLPHKFEAGTTNYIGACALARAIEYIQNLGLDKIQQYESELLNYATTQIKKIDGIKLYGQASQKASILSFGIENAHPMDIGMIIDKMGIAVRTGTHCTQPVMQHYNITGTVRASFVFYNTFSEIDKFIEAVKTARQMLV